MNLIYLQLLHVDLPGERLVTTHLPDKHAITDWKVCLLATSNFLHVAVQVKGLFGSHNPPAGVLLHSNK